MLHRLGQTPEFQQTFCFNLQKDDILAVCRDSKLPVDLNAFIQLWITAYMQKVHASCLPNNSSLVFYCLF